MATLNRGMMWERDLPWINVNSLFHDVGKRPCESLGCDVSGSWNRNKNAILMTVSDNIG